MVIADYYLYPDWKEKASNLICGFTLPALGNMALTRKSVSSGITTKENRIKLAGQMNYDPKKVFSPRQIHSDKVIIVDEKLIGMGAFSKTNALEGDACITNLKNIVLIVTWADCVPVILFDENTGWIGAIHSGWRSTRSEIVKKTIDLLKRKGSDLESISAAIGPGIRDCCYKVGNEFLDCFKDKIYQDLFKTIKDELYFDLTGAVFQQLISSGIKNDNIDFYGKCTACSESPSFFSCRKDGINFEGQAAFIGMMT